MLIQISRQSTTESAEVFRKLIRSEPTSVASEFTFKVWKKKFFFSIDYST